MTPMIVCEITADPAEGNEAGGAKRSRSPGSRAAEFGATSRVNQKRIPE
jgi:hypothetical protein